MITSHIKIVAVLSLCLLATVCNGAEDLTTQVTESTSDSAITTGYEDPASVFTNQQTPVVQCGCNSCNSCNNCCDQPVCGCGDCCKPLFMSDHEFDGFIEPVTNFVGAIDPRSRTRARGIFVHQNIPGDSILGEGDLQLYALQLSVALTDRLAIIAEKDGYATLNTAGIGSRKGWADVSAGVKYVLVRDVEEQRLLTAGVMYDVPLGSDAVFQGNNDGIWTFFLTGGQEFADGNAHIMGTFGWRLPNNKSKDTESLYYSLHLDYEVFEGWYGLWEFNGILFTDSGNALASPQEGGDLLNLGANNVDGNHVATTAFGITRVFNRNLSAAVAYEIPVTSRNDLFENRTTATVTLTY